MTAQMQLAGLQQVLDALEHLAHVERLGDEVASSRREPALAHLGVQVAGENQERNPVRGLDAGHEALHDAEAVQPGHVQIEQNQIGRV